MQTEAVKPYYEILQKKQIGLIFKRSFDIVVSLIMLLILSPVFLVLAIAIKLDSKGPVFYRQVRVTQYGKEFRIFKFRTMVNNADKIGSQYSWRFYDLCRNAPGSAEICRKIHTGDVGNTAAARRRNIRSQYPL